MKFKRLLQNKELNVTTRKKDDLIDQNQQAAANQDTRETVQQQHRVPYTAEKMPRPNDPCPCGSGKKF